MPGIFTKENFARLEPSERGYLMRLQMSRNSGSSPYLPDDCTECACGYPVLGTGMCNTCYEDWDRLIKKALGEVDEPAPGTLIANL